MWQPILKDKLRESALDSVHAIANALSEPSPHWFPFGNHSDADNEVTSSLCNGLAGIYLFYVYCSLIFDRDDYRAAAERYCSILFDSLEKTSFGPTLCEGLAGIGWVIEHARKANQGADEELIEPIDEALLSYLNQTPREDKYDLLTGLVGIGVYAHERLPHPTARYCLESVTERLAELSVSTRDGITWHTPPFLVIQRKQKQYPQGYYDMGLAHGVPGIISLLSMIHNQRIAKDTVESLLQGAVHWLLRQKLQAEGESVFPHCVSPDSAAPSTVLGWCYGDLSVAASLFCAARATGEPSWKMEAITTAEHAANRRPFSHTKTYGTAFCHGSSGTGHLFNRFFQETGEEIFSSAASYWFQTTLDARRADHEGIVGFTSFICDINDPKKNIWPNNPGLLNGAAGIALSLLAACGDREPRWDKVFLLDFSSCVPR